MLLLPVRRVPRRRPLGVSSGGATRLLRVSRQIRLAQMGKRKEKQQAQEGQKAGFLNGGTIVYAEVRWGQQGRLSRSIPWGRSQE